MTDPVSWLQIEPGWSVAGSDGAILGAVRTVTGDKQADIFDGLAVGAGETDPIRYVPGEQVAAIFPGEVRLRISAAEFGGLDRYEAPPPEAPLRLPRRSLGSRFSDWLRGGR